MQTEIRSAGTTGTLGRPRSAESPRSWLEAPAAAELWELELSPRARSALLRAGATTVGEVQALRPWQLSRLYGVGPKTMGELEPLLRVLGDRPTPEPRLEDAVDEIVDSVLDAADVEILEAPMRRLGEVLTELPDAEAAERFSGAERSAALEEARSLAGKVSRYYQALADLAGDERLARRLRQSLAARPASHSPRRTKRPGIRTPAHEVARITGT